MKTKQILFIFLTLVTLHVTLEAKDVLLPLVKEGESFENRNNFYIPSRSPINAIAISPNGNSILSGSYDNSLKLWDIKTGKVLKSFEGIDSGKVEMLS